MCAVDVPIISVYVVICLLNNKGMRTINCPCGVQGGGYIQCTSKTASSEPHFAQRRWHPSISSQCIHGSDLGISSIRVPGIMTRWAAAQINTQTWLPTPPLSIYIHIVLQHPMNMNNKLESSDKGGGNHSTPVTLSWK